MKFTQLLFVLAFLFLNTPKNTFAASFTKYEFGQGASKAWLFVPDSTEVDRLVVLLHGYGASNPACYGGWINDLLSNGHAVLFPKFQWWLLYPSTSLYTKRVLKNIEEVDSFFKSKNISYNEGLILAGHSIGGVIAGNVANHYGKTKTKKVGGLLLVQSGPPYFNVINHNSFKHVSDSTVLIAITGKNDFVVGKWHARQSYRKSKQIPDDRKVWLHQVPNRRRFRILDATHVEPVSPDKSFDTGNRNWVIWGALWLGDENYVDSNVYYRLTKYMIDIASDSAAIIDKNSPELTKTGSWKGRPLKPLVIKR